MRDMELGGQTVSSPRLIHLEMVQGMQTYLPSGFGNFGYYGQGEGCGDGSGSCTYGVSEGFGNGFALPDFSGYGIGDGDGEGDKPKEWIY